MKRERWYLALIIALLLILVSLASGCTLTASQQGNASPPATTPDTDNVSNPSPDTTKDTATSSATSTPPDETLVGIDPVSGQSQEADLNWEQLCLSSEYQIQIAKDPGFTIIVLDTGAFAPADSTTPAAYYPAGGLATSPSAIGGWGNLEAGHTYYVRIRVRQAATGQYMLSPWSEVKSFTVKSGLPVSNTWHGLQPLYPINDGRSYPVKPVSFTWSSFQDTTKYRFVLAEDAALTQVIKNVEVATTAYEYDGQLEYGQSYFWRVMAVEPVPSDWSATFSFRTEAAPLSTPAQPMLQSETPLWAWVATAIGLALLIAIIVLTFRARRR